MGNWGIERSDLPKVSHHESVEKVGTYIVSIHSILFHNFLERTWEQKEASTNTSLCKLDQLNQPTSINWGLLFI